MNIVTSSAASTSTSIANQLGQAGFVIVVADASAAPLRVVTGLDFRLNGVLTADPDGILIPAGGSFELPSGAYTLRTGTNGTPASATVMAINPRLM